MRSRAAAFLFLSLLLFSSLLLVSCGHECIFSEKWSADGDCHWRACTFDGCSEISSRGAHVWVEGETVLYPHPDSDGSVVFNCTVCGHEKTESVAFEGYTESGWEQLFDRSRFANFTYTERTAVRSSGITFETVSVQKHTEKGVHISIEIAGQTAEQSYSADKTEEVLDAFLASLAPFVDYGAYTYDPQSKLYKLSGEIYVESLGAVLDDASIKFEGGRITELTYSCRLTNSGIESEATTTASFTDYGATTID